MRPSVFFFIFSLTLSASADDPRGDHPEAKPLSPMEELATFHVPPGFEVQLVASEPALQKPINITFDGAGRLWVTGSEMYPWPAGTDAAGQPIPNFEKSFAEIGAAFRAGDKAPKPSMVAKDSVMILSDFGPDGHAGNVTVFADGLNIPSGVQHLPRKPGAKGDTAIVYSIPNIWRLEDTTGNGRADKREVLYGPFGYLDTHGGSSSYLYWVDGWIYGTHGFRNHSEVHDRQGRMTLVESGNTYRFRPDGSKFEIYSHGQTNPFGLTVDPLGNFYTADSHSKPVYLVLRGGYYEGIGKSHDGLGYAPRITDDDHGSSAIGGIAYYAAEQYPEEFRGNLFNGNPVTQKINRDKLEWHGSTPKAIRQPDFMTSDDKWFRPVQVKLGPDGALYIADFYNPIIGHYEVPLTDPHRDHRHGRIWRVVWRGEKKEVPVPAMPDLAKLDAKGLMEKLGDPNLIVRTLATNELADRGGNDVLKELQARSEKIVKGGKYSQEDIRRFGHAAWLEPKIQQVRQSGGLSDEEVKAGRLYFEAEGILFKSEIPEIAVHQLKSNAIRFGLETNALLDDERTVAPFYLRLVSKDGNIQRAVVECLFPSAKNLGNFKNETHPELGIELVLKAFNKADPLDTEFIYATKVLLREILGSKSPSSASEAYENAAKIVEKNPEYSEILASVSLAVKSPESAAFVLSHLQRTKLKSSTPTGSEVKAAKNPMTGTEYTVSASTSDYLKHVALNLPPERVGALLELGKSDGGTPSLQFSVASALLNAEQQRKLALSPDAQGWIKEVLLAALEKGDLKLVLPVAKDAKFPEKAEPLKKIALDPKRDGTLRAAALEALMNLPAGRETAGLALADLSNIVLRKKAAELLGQIPDAAPALLAALPSAPAELATVLAAGLAKTDAGCGDLLALIEAGKAAPTLLRNKLVSSQLDKRPTALKDRVAKLTKDLPTEDARLDKLIAQRADAYNAAAKANIEHGAQVFQTNCAVCHRFRNAGGNVGPNLDGVSARGVHRLLEDILDPNRIVEPAFRPTVIEMNDGTVAFGVNLRDQGGELLLTDATGKELRVTKNTIKKQSTSPVSLMPPVFETTLKPEELNDLLGFLLTPAK